MRLAGREQNGLYPSLCDFMSGLEAAAVAVGAAVAAAAAAAAAVGEGVMAKMAEVSRKSSEVSEKVTAPHIASQHNTAHKIRCTQVQSDTHDQMVIDSPAAIVAVTAIHVEDGNHHQIKACI